MNERRNNTHSYGGTNKIFRTFKYSVRQTSLARHHYVNPTPSIRRGVHATHFNAPATGRLLFRKAPGREEPQSNGKPLLCCVSVAG